MPAELPAAPARRQPSPSTLPTKQRVRLSQKERRELAALPDEIEALEREQVQLAVRMSAPDHHRLGRAQMSGDRRRLEDLEALLLQKFASWE